MARYLTLPSPKGTGILGSTKSLNLESLRRPDQRWDSPQALIRVCPTSNSHYENGSHGNSLF